MRSILILSFSSIQHDARVTRQIEFLCKNYHVTVAAYSNHQDSKLDFIEIEKPKLGMLKKIVTAYFLFLRVHKISYQLMFGQKTLSKTLNNRIFDLVIANDIDSLPLAFQLNVSQKILLDAHEYSPRQFEDKLMWRILFQPLMNHICKKYIPKTVGMTTIGRGIANEYRKQFNCNPVVLNNATWYNPIPPTEVSSDKIRLIHHGGATISRQLEIMIEMMALLDNRFTLDLMLIVPDTASAKTKGYIDYLKGLAKGDPRINFVPAVKSKEVIPFINRYDMGVILVPPINFNYANGLPNKLFEFIQAKLAVAIGPIPEIAEVVNQFDLGFVSEEFTAKSLASKLQNISKEELIRFKQNSCKAAIELSADKNSKLLNEIVSNSLKVANNS